MYVYRRGTVVVDIYTNDSGVLAHCTARVVPARESVPGLCQQMIRAAERRSRMSHRNLHEEWRRAQDCETASEQRRPKEAARTA